MPKPGQHKPGNPVRRTVQAAVRYLAAYLLLLAAMVTALWGACALRGNIRRNVAASLSLFKEEGLYPQPCGFKLFQLDNYTDLLMLWEAVSVEEEAPFRAAMTTPIYEMDDYETLAQKLEIYLEKGGGSLEGAMHYNRYWHGYLVVLRPLLMVFTLRGVRIVHYIVLTALLAAVLLRCYKVLGAKAALCFAASQLAVSVWLVPHQNQYVWAFYLAYIGCLLALGRTGKTPEDFFLALFCLGGGIAYFELLVTPLITLGLPCCLWLACRREMPVRGRTLGVIAGSVSWAVGYGLFWGSRWVIAGLVTGEDVISNALNQMGLRTGGGTATWKGMELTLGNIAGYLLRQLTGRGLLAPAACALVLAAACYCLFCYGWKAVGENADYLLCALMTPVWFFVLREHSVQHFWYTWRCFSITVLALLLFVSGTCSRRTARKRVSALLRRNKP